MGTPATLTYTQNLVKKNYTSQVTEEVCTRNYITLSKITKKSMGGDPQHLPLITSDGAGVATDIVSAEASALGMSSTAFSVNMGSLFGSVQVLTKTRLAFKGDNKLVANYVKKEIDMKMNGMGRAYSSYLYGAGGGALLQVLSISTNTFTPANTKDILNIWEGMQLVFSTGNGTSAGHSLRTGSPGYLTVQSVDRGAGTFTTDAVAGVTGVAANDFVFIRGGFAGNVSQTELFKGFGVWFPTAAPTDTLWGLARTGKSELAGFITPSADVAGGPLQRISKGLLHGYTQMNATPRDVVLHPSQRYQMNVSMQNQGLREISVSETTGTAGYRKLVYTADHGDVDIWSDPFANSQIGYMLDFSSFHIRHFGEKFIDFDMPDDDKGSMWYPLTNNAGHSLRLYSFANLMVESPYKNGTIPLAAV